MPNYFRLSYYTTDKFALENFADIEDWINQNHQVLEELRNADYLPYEYHISLTGKQTTTSTGSTEVGEIISLDPTYYPDDTEMYFEGTLRVGDGSATATAELYDKTNSTVLATISTSSTSAVRVRSSQVAMPSNSTDIRVRIKTSNTSYTCTLEGARILYRFPFTQYI